MSNIFKSKDPKLLSWGKNRLGRRLAILESIEDIKHMRNLIIGHRYFLSHIYSTGYWVTLKKKWFGSSGPSSLRLLVEVEITDSLGLDKPFRNKGDIISCHVGNLYISPEFAIHKIEPSNTESNTTNWEKWCKILWQWKIDFIKKNYG